MRNINLVVDHHIGEGQALERIKKFLTNVPTEYGNDISNFNLRWEGKICNFDFIIAKSKISGSVKVDNKSVIIVGKIPFAFLILKNKIQTTIEKQTKEILKK